MREHTMTRRTLLGAAAATGVSGALPTRAATGGIKILAAGSALYGMRPCAEDFTRVTGIAVEVATDHGHNIRKAALAGSAEADVIAVPTEWASEIVAAGRADKATLVEIGAVRIGVAVRADAPKPDVATMAA